MDETAEEFERRVENIREAMRTSWAEGYAQGRLDSVDSMLGDAPSRTNPYTKEQS